MSSISLCFVLIFDTSCAIVASKGDENHERANQSSSKSPRIDNGTILLAKSKRVLTALPIRLSNLFVVSLVSVKSGCALAKARCSTRAQNLLLTVWPPSIIWMSGKKPSSPLSSSSALPIRRLSFATSINWPQRCLSRPRRWTSMPKLKPIVRNFLRRKKRRSLSLPPLVQPPTRAEISQKGSCASLHKSLLRCQCNETNFMANFW